ncbi:MAG: response regulator, partial [Verrucomicrobiae bacterium]|nr:response regulator [Verrucomicrobiae bacterium]
RVLRRQLELWGMRVVSAESGQQALTLLDAPGATPPEIVITDMHMPGMTGVECLIEMKKLRPGLKAVILTGSPEHYETASLGNPVAVLSKPVQRAELLEQIRKAIAAPGCS